MAARTRVTITVDGPMLRRIDRIAAAKKQTRCAWFRDVVADAIDQDEAAVKVFTDPLLRETLLKAFGQPGMLKAFAEAVGTELQTDQLKLFEERISMAAEPGVRKKK